MESRTPSQAQAPSTAQENIHLETYISFLVTSYNKLDDDIAELKDRFDAMKTEGKSMEFMAKYGVNGAIALFTAMWSLFFVLYYASRTDSGELTCLKAKHYLAGLIMGATALKMYFVDPKDRLFAVSDLASKIIKNSYPEMSQEYDAMITSLKFFEKNLQSTYGNPVNEQKMKLIFSSLRKEIEYLEQNKKWMTINKVQDRIKNYVYPIMDQARYEIENTPNYTPGLFKQVDSRIREEHKKLMEEPEVNLRIMGNMV